MLCITVEGKSPQADGAAFIAPNAVLAGDVRLGAGASVWYGAVLRADSGCISIGPDSNIQDNATLHTGPAKGVVVGRGVTVGHGAILHGCTVGDGCMIGMHATVLDGAQIGAGSLVAAGALVPEHTVIPPGSLVMGSPAKAVRPLRPEERESLPHSAQLYRELSAAQLPAAGQEVTT